MLILNPDKTKVVDEPNPTERDIVIHGWLMFNSHANSAYRYKIAPYSIVSDTKIYIYYQRNSRGFHTETQHIRAPHFNIIKNLSTGALPVIRW